MKMKTTTISTILLIIVSLTASAQSSKTNAQYDSKLIAGSIEDFHDILYFTQKAMDRASDTRTKEIAQEMLTDYTTTIYSFEQLASAGSGSGNHAEKGEGIFKETSAFNSKLSLLSGFEYDTLWVSNLIIMQQAKYDEFTQAKEKATNSQLKAAVTEAIPVIRKHNSKLKSLQKSLVRMMIQEKKEAARKKVR